MDSIIVTVFYSLLYLNERGGFYGLKYMYSVISVIFFTTCNTKNRESTRSLTVGVSTLLGGLRVEFLLKTESGYLRDAEVT